MTPLWESLIARVLSILERALQLWLAFKSGQWNQQKKDAENTAAAKDEQSKIAAERPRDRDDLVRWLRERGF
jgi:hypothetical protein